MTAPAKILFDECIPRPVIPPLIEFLNRTSAGDAEVKHLLDLFDEGQKDQDWVPAIAADGWIVISGDRASGRRGGGGHLKEVCRAYGVTHVLLSPSLHNSKIQVKSDAIYHFWPRICALAELERGSRWQIKLKPPDGFSFAQVEYRD